MKETELLPELKLSGNTLCLVGLLKMRPKVLGRGCCASCLYVEGLDMSGAQNQCPGILSCLNITFLFLVASGAACAAFLDDLQPGHKLISYEHHGTWHSCTTLLHED